jgi:hypothetical protein
MTWVYVAVIAVTVITGAAEANQQRQAGRANQQIAENNARLDEAQAQDAANLGARESQQSAWRTRALMGQQRAAFAANNLDSALGTPFDLQTDAALFGGADKSAIQLNAARKAWGFGASALNNRNQGALANWQGQSSSKITILKTIGSAIGAAGGAAGGGGSAASSSSGSSAYGPYSSGYRYPSSYGSY